MSASTLVLLAISPLFAGFVYLPYRHVRDHGLTIDGRWGSAAAALCVAALFVTAASVEWANPWRAWVEAGGVGVLNRAWPLIWALFALPLWALALIAFPAAARDLCAALPALGAAELGVIRALGWFFIGVSWSLFGLVVAVGG